MYKYLHLTSDLLFHNRRRMALLIIQIVFLSFLAIDSFQQIIHAVYPQTVFNKANIEQMVYFQPNSVIYNAYSGLYGENFNTESDPYACFRKLNGLKSIENCYTLSGKDKTVLFAAGNNMHAMLKPKMIKGKWIATAAPSELYVRCVTSNRNCNLGDVLEFVDLDSEKSIWLVITGIASDPYIEFNNSVTGAKTLTDMVDFTDKETLNADGTLLWINYDDIPEVNNYSDFEKMFSVSSPFYQTARYLFFDGSLTHEQMQNNLDLLSSDGIAFTNQVAENYKDESLEKFKNENLPILICVMIICLIGSCFTIAVSIGESSLNFNIYWICGAHRSQSIKVSFCLVGLSVLIADLPFLILLPFGSRFAWFGWTSMALSSGFLCIALLNIFILSATFLTSYISLCKKSFYGVNKYDNM